MNKRQAKKFIKFWKGHKYRHGYLRTYKKFIRVHNFLQLEREKRWRTKQKWWFKRHFKTLKWKVYVMRKGDI